MLSRCLTKRKVTQEGNWWAVSSFPLFLIILHLAWLVHLRIFCRWGWKGSLISVIVPTCIDCCRVHQGQITSNQVLLPVLDQLKSTTLSRVCAARVSFLLEIVETNFDSPKLIPVQSLSQTLKKALPNMEFLSAYQTWPPFSCGSGSLLFMLKTYCRTLLASTWQRSRSYSDTLKRKSKSSCLLMQLIDSGRKRKKRKSELCWKWRHE